MDSDPSRESFGIESTSGTEKGLLDPWGNPYFLLLDYNGDGTLTEPPMLGNLTFNDRSFLMWSAGPDGKYGTPQTNLDNLYNYPGHTHTFQSMQARMQNARTLLFLQLIPCGITLIYLWLSRFRTFPLFSMLSGKVFESYLKRHRSRALYIMVLIGFETILSICCLRFTSLEPVIIAGFLLSLGCLHLSFLYIPRLKALTPESSPAVAHLTLIPALLWSARLGAVYYALKII